jgi:hypothetical protein
MLHMGGVFLSPTEGNFLHTVALAVSVIIIIIIIIIIIVGRDISVGIATRYGLGGPGIESRWGVRLSAFVQTGPGDHPASYTMGIGSFPGVKWPGRGVDHPLQISADVKQRVELYLYSPFGPSLTVLG